MSATSISRGLPDATMPLTRWADYLTQRGRLAVDELGSLLANVADLGLPPEIWQHLTAGLEFVTLQAQLVQLAGERLTGLAPAGLLPDGRYLRAEGAVGRCVPFLPREARGGKR